MINLASAYGAHQEMFCYESQTSFSTLDGAYLALHGEHGCVTGVVGAWLANSAHKIDGLRLPDHADERAE